MDSNYIPKFILDNRELFQIINENIKSKNYDNLTLNLRNLVSLALKPSDLLDIHYSIVSHKKNGAVTAKILITELKKSPLYNEVDKIKDTLDLEHKNYLLTMFHNKLRYDNRKLRTKIFIMIPITILVYFMAKVSTYIYQWAWFVVCLSSFPILIKKIVANKKIIKLNII